MIIEALLNLLLSFLKLVFSGINFPESPPEMVSNLTFFLDSLDYAQTFIPLFLPINLTPYVSLAAGLFAVNHLYKPIKWIINKIIEVIP